jgi:predicted helicase
MIEIRNYQNTIINKTIHHFIDNDKALLNMCCGSGKTITSLLIAKKMKVRKLLILVPTIILVNQWIKNISTIFKNKSIKSFKNNDVDKYEIIISTYHNAYKIKNNDLEFDLVILDESHHLTGNITNITNDNNNFLHALNINSIKQLSLTATIKKLSNKNSIDNLNLDYFGECIANYNIRWGINNNVITDFDIQILLTDINNNDFIVDTLYLSAFIALKNIESKLSNHILIYSNKIVHCELIIKYIKELINDKIFKLPDNIIYFDYTSKSDKISPDIIDYYDYSIITSVYSLGEGFDLPKMDTVIFSENMTSEIRIIQSALRPCRKYFNKERALIILPIIYNNGIAIKSDFSKIKKFINAIENSHELDKEFILSRLKIIDYSIQKKKSFYNIETNYYDNNNINRILKNIILSKNDFNILDEKSNKVNAFLNNNFTFSKILLFKLDANIFENITNSKAKKELYYYINNRELILNNSIFGTGVLNKGKHPNKDVDYLDSLDMFIRGVNNNASMKEIVILSHRLNINIYLKIKLKNKTIVEY